MERTGTWRVWAVAAAIVLLPLLVHVAHKRALPVVYSGEAFAAYRCGAAALLERRDPYLVEPLRGCEARAHVIPPGAVEPAPLPPVTLGFFAPFAALPYGAGAILWAAVLIAAYAAAAFGLVRLAPRVPPVAIWLALAPNLVFLNGYYGETPPLVAAALVLGGLALREKRIVAAAAAVTVATLFEPHIGGAAWLALFLIVPASRVPLFAGGIATVALSVLFVGYDTAFSYLAAVLPAHAVSELPANDQYSLTSLLYQMGWPARAALTAGVASYALAFLAGCAFAPVLAKRMNAPELIVFLPAGAVVLGGTFIHDLQLSLALPLTVVVANNTTRTGAWLAYATMLVGAIPEPTTALPDLAFGAAAAYALGWSAARLAGGRLRPELAGGFATAGYAAFAVLVHRIGAAAQQVPAAFHAAPAGAIAEPSWADYVAAVSHPATPGEFVTKLTVYALLAAALALVAVTRRSGVPLPTKPLFIR